MPFGTHTDAPMPVDPPVRIFFHGLVVLRSPASTSSWFAETLREFARHTLSVEVRMKEAGKPDMILFRHHGELRGQGLNITAVRADETPIPARALKYIPLFAGAPPGERAKDFRLALNLGDALFHNTSLRVKEQKIRPAIEFSGGHSILYSALLREDTIEVLQGDPPEPTGKTLPRLASIVGANLYLEPAGSKVRITGHGLSRPLELPKPEDNSPVRYEIYVENSPLVESMSSEHSELAEYYEVIEKANGDDVDPAQRFDLKFPTVGVSLTGSEKFSLSAGRASIRIPCMPMFTDD